MLHRIYGSIHFHNQKSATKDKPITPLEYAPDYVVLPMTMHPGTLCEPIVKQGDKVLLGQKVAEPVDDHGVPIHSPISGVVSCIQPRPCFDGTLALSVVIDNNFQNIPALDLECKTDPDRMTGLEIADLVTQAGIVDLGSTGFPVGARLKDSIGKVDTLIIDATEGESYITAEHRLILERSEQILSGVELLMQALSLSTARIAITSNQTDAIMCLREQIAADSGIRVVPLKSRYPFGAEKQLIQKLTGRKVPPGKLPHDVKCAVFNISTTIAVHEAVCLGRPLTQRVMTVSGSAVKDPANLVVPIGTPLECLLESCGGLIAMPHRVLLGGTMTGIAQGDLSSCTTKNTNALLFPAPWEPSLSSGKEFPCIRCGRCVKVCPMKLVPANFHQYATNDQYDKLEKSRIVDCIECGCCAYVCPAHIPLVEQIRTAKKHLQSTAQSDDNLQNDLQTTDPIQSGEEDSGEPK